jgi:hypothetical protein
MTLIIETIATYDEALPKMFQLFIPGTSLVLRRPNGQLQEIA